MVRRLNHRHLPSPLRGLLEGQQTLLIELVVQLNVGVIVADLHLHLLLVLLTAGLDRPPEGEIY